MQYHCWVSGRLVDTPPPDAVDQGTLAAALRREWSIDPVDVEYVPKGVGSYHWRVTADGVAYFVTVDDLDSKPYIGRDRASAFAGLVDAYRAAWWLRHRAGLAVAVPPIETRAGLVAVLLDEQYSIATFPFVSGTPGTWGEAMPLERRLALAKELVRLHAAVADGRPRLQRRRHELPEWEELVDALASLDQSWTGGAFSEPARQALAAHAPLVRARLARFNALAAELDASAQSTVITHGEPHPGNLISAPDGLRLIDWDTAALAEPERDLWMLADTPGAFDAYSKVSGRTLDRSAIEFWSLAWTLSDIAGFAAMFRSPHVSTRWAETKLQGFLRLLAGSSAEPYGSL